MPDPDDIFTASTAALFGGDDNDDAVTQAQPQGRQRVSQETHNLSYAGSNPAPATNQPFLTELQRRNRQIEEQDYP